MFSMLTPFCAHNVVLILWLLYVYYKIKAMMTFLKTTEQTVQVVEVVSMNLDTILKVQLLIHCVSVFKAQHFKYITRMPFI